MENYYKILEVDKDASQEIIDKAYKILVKKYHPDLQSDSQKSISENKIKKINEAYSVLSDPIKRENYNKQLLDTQVTIDEYNILANENLQLKKELYNIKSQLNDTSKYFNNKNNSSSFNPQIQQPSKKYNYPKKHSIFKKIFMFLYCIFFTYLIIYIILQNPYIKELLNISYNSKILLPIVILILIIFLFNSKK